MESGGGLRGQKTYFSIGFRTFSKIVKAFLKNGKNLGEVSGIKNVVFSLVLETFWKFGQNWIESGGGLWGQKC